MPNKVLDDTPAASAFSMGSTSDFCGSLREVLGAATMIRGVFTVLTGLLAPVVTEGAAGSTYFSPSRGDMAAITRI